MSVGALVELDRALFELAGQEADFVLELPSYIQEELRHAGFLMRDEDGSDLQFCVPARFANFKLAVADAISWLATPPPWAADTFEGLFEIERLIRWSGYWNASYLSICPMWTGGASGISGAVHMTQLGV